MTSQIVYGMLKPAANFSSEHVKQFGWLHQALWSLDFGSCIIALVQPSLNALPQLQHHPPFVILLVIIPLDATLAVVDS